MTNLSFHMKRLWSKYLLEYERELYVEGAMVTEDTDHSRQPIWKTADHTSDASSMGPRKMAKTGSCDKAVATQLVGQCLLGQDSIMQDAQAADGASEDSPICPQVTVRLNSENQTCISGSMQLHSESPQQLQQEVHPYKNVWLVVPTSVAESLAVSSQTVEVGTGSEGSFGEHTQSPRSIAVVQSSMLKDDPLPESFQGEQTRVTANLGVQLQDQQEDPAPVEPPSAVVDAGGHMQLMCLDEWYKQRLEELRANHEEDMTKMKETIDSLKSRISVLEGNLTAMGSMAEGARICFNALLQAVQSSAAPSLPLLKLLAISAHQHSTPECGLAGSSSAAREPSTPPNSGSR